MGLDKFTLLVFCMLCSLGFANEALASKPAKYWSLWDRSNEQYPRSIDHRGFDQLLDKYVIIDHPSGINRFRYAGVMQSDARLLDRYIKKWRR